MKYENVHVLLYNLNNGQYKYKMDINNNITLFKDVRCMCFLYVDILGTVLQPTAFILFYKCFISGILFLH